MTNAEKFEEVFGVEPDTGCCILMCETMSYPCEYFEELDGGCNCNKWWYEQYKEKRK